MKSNLQKGFSAVELLIVLVVISIISAVGFFIYKSHSTKYIKSDTECFSISVPETYKITATKNTCQFAAYLGNDRKNPDALVLIVPYMTKVTSVQDLVLKTLVAPKNTDNSDGFTKIGGYEATYTKGPAKGKQFANYGVFSTKTYSPSARKYETNAFRVTLITPKYDTDTAKKVINSIIWK